MREAIIWLVLAVLLSLATGLLIFIGAHPLWFFATGMGALLCLVFAAICVAIPGDAKEQRR